MPKKIRMVLVVVSMKQPYSILFPKTNPTDDDIMETLGDAIINKERDIDECFSIKRIPVEDEIPDE